MNEIVEFESNLIKKLSVKFDRPSNLTRPKN